MKKITDRQKIIIISLSFLMMASGVFFSNPKKVEALFCGDTPANPCFSYETPLSIAQPGSLLFNTSALVVKETTADPIAYAVGKVMLRQFTNSMVNWINGGFKGRPLFVTNLGGYLKEAADQASGVLLEEMLSPDMLKNICSPFRLQLPRALIFSRKVPFDIKMRCTLSDVIGNIKAFQNDFSAGGWDAFLSMSQNPQNNPYGAYLISLDEIQQARAKAEEQANSEYKAGKGFIGVKQCVEVSPEGGICARYETKTPGAAISDALGKGAFGSAFRQLEVADEIDEIAAAALNQLVSYAIGPGAGSGGVRSYNPAPVSAPSILSAGSDNEYSSQLDDFITTQTRYLNLKQTSLFIASTTIPILQNLESCSLGKYNSKISKIKDKQAELQTQIQEAEKSLDYMKFLGRKKDEALKQISGADTTESLKQSSAQLSDIYYEIKYKIKDKVGSISQAELELGNLSTQKQNYQQQSDSCVPGSGFPGGVAG